MFYRLLSMAATMVLSLITYFILVLFHEQIIMIRILEVAFLGFFLPPRLVFGLLAPSDAPDVPFLRILALVGLMVVAGSFYAFLLSRPPYWLEAWIILNIVSANSLVYLADRGYIKMPR